MELEPVAYVWDGDAMVPLDRFLALARRQFRPGVEYALVVHKGRSEESHRHYFACIKKGWYNLPEKWTFHRNGQVRFPSPEYLRKWCLIKEGYADVEDGVFADAEQAEKWLKRMKKRDRHCVVDRQENVITIWTAQSQDHASMGHEDFQRSKDRVLGRIANMCGISVAELTKNAKENA